MDHDFTPHPSEVVRWLECKTLESSLSGLGNDCGNHPFGRALLRIFRHSPCSLSGAGELATRVGDRLSEFATFSDASEDQMTS